MQRSSRRKLAVAATDAMHKYPVKMLAKILAVELQTSRRLREADLLVQDIAAERARRGQVTATIFSARALSKTLLKKINLWLLDRLQAERIETATVLDPAVVGGFKIITPNETIDASIFSKLNNLKHLQP